MNAYDTMLGAGRFAPRCPECGEESSQGEPCSDECATMCKVREVNADNAYLRKENESLWESIYEKDEVIGELQRMLAKYT